MCNFKLIGKTVFVFLLITGRSFGQNESTIDLQQTAKARIEERLVRLAWENNPLNKIVVYNSEIAQKNFTQEKWVWLDKVKLQGNLNEFTIEPDRYVRSQFFPRYNISVTFSLADFATIPLSVQKRRSELAISKLEIENQKILMRSEVLKKFNHYLSVRGQLSIQRKRESEINANLELAKSKFNNSQIDYATLSSMTQIHYDQQIVTLQLEEALREAAVDVEALIGVKIDTVLADNY